MKRLFVGVLLMLTMGGCLTAAEKSSIAQANSVNASIPTPTCSSDAECKDMWAATQLWMAGNLNMKLRTISDSILETYEPLDMMSSYGAAAKVPVGNGVYEIRVGVLCTRGGLSGGINRMTGCNASVAESNFKKYIWTFAKPAVPGTASAAAPTSAPASAAARPPTATSQPALAVGTKLFSNDGAPFGTVVLTSDTSVAVSLVGGGTATMTIEQAVRMQTKKDQVSTTPPPAESPAPAAAPAPAPARSLTSGQEVNRKQAEKWISSLSYWPITVDWTNCQKAFEKCSTSEYGNFQKVKPPAEGEVWRAAYTSRGGGGQWKGEDHYFFFTTNGIYRLIRDSYYLFDGGKWIKKEK